MNGPALTLSIRPSRLLARAVAVIHLLAGAAVVLADQAWLYRLPLLVAIAISLVVALRGSGILILRGQADGGLALRAGDDWQPARVWPDSLLLPWLIVLRYRLEASDRTLTRVILPDSLAADDFRRLRVWLKWRASVAGSAEPVA